MVQVYQLLMKEQDKNPGFKYVVNEIFNKQLKNADNLRLTALATSDYEDYLGCASRA